MTLALTAVGATHAIAAPPSYGAWRIFLEAKFMRPPVGGPALNAERTVLAAGYLGDDGLTPFTEEAFNALNIEWPQYIRETLENGNDDTNDVKVTYVRNKKKVIEYAEVRSERGLIGSATLAPKFRALFEETIGPEILVAPVSRHVAYIFPKLASNYQDYAPMVLQTYKGATYPITLEVFEISAAGLKAIGCFADPARD